PRQDWGLTYALPQDLRHDSGATLVDGDSPDGRRLRDGLSARGMPGGLAELGFGSVADLWPPWCAALVDGEMTSVAFAARLSAGGAELGVTTARAFRGRGHAAAVAAGWSRLPALRSRTLFYSTGQANISSQRVVARLGLRLIGPSLRLT
ncbi:GNAT family N-acetyltransferase, partial [Inquilinus limosus]